MKLPRRKFLHLAAGAAALPAISQVAWAQTYPSRPVRIIVGGLPAGPIDIAARIIGLWLQDRLGQPFVVEDRPGAGGNIATELVVRSAPDGYTLLMTQSSAAINTTLYEKLNFDFLRDIAPVASVIRIPLVLEANPSFPAKTVAELIAYAKANPDEINLASPAIGTAPQVAGELYGVLSSIEQIRAGKLSALAVATATRLEVLPDIPIVADTVPGFEASGWSGICAPKNTPAEIVDKLNIEINAALADPKIKARFADAGAIPFAGSPGDFAKFIADETEKWAKVIKFAGLKPD
jgi:tripartite-type tricarboxylate transporter receptor subunit TctC